MDIERHTLKSSVQKDIRLSYLRYVPHVFWQNPEVEYPLLLWLHDYNLRGRDLVELQDTDEMRYLREESDLPAIIIAPQCPPYDDWGIHQEAIHMLIDDPVAMRGVDAKRRWLVGSGMGSIGAVRLAYQRPDDFAALVLLTGMGEPDFMNYLRHIPLWIFHGLEDEEAPVEHAELLYYNHGRARYSSFSLSRRDLWTEVILRTTVLQWLQEQTK